MQMFMVPSLITMSVAATRMYRSLADFTSATEVYDILVLYLSSKLTVIYITVASWTRNPPIEWVSLS